MKNDLVRDHIILSSIKVFKELGYEKVTMNDIARASDKVRSSLYYYFSNKQEVFEQVAEVEYLSIIDTARKMIGPSRSIEENLTNYNKGKLSSLISKTKEYTYLVEDIRQDLNLSHSLFMKLRHIETEIFHNIINWGLENKEIAPIEPENIQFLAMTMVTAYNSLEKEILLYGTIDDMLIRLKWLVNTLIKGLKYDN